MNKSIIIGDIAGDLGDVLDSETKLVSIGKFARQETGVKTDYGLLIPEVRIITQTEEGYSMDHINFILYSKNRTLKHPFRGVLVEKRRAHAEVLRSVEGFGEAERYYNNIDGQFNLPIAGERYHFSKEVFNMMYKDTFQALISNL
jgi:hypothetical protein